MASAPVDAAHRRRPSALRRLTARLLNVSLIGSSLLCVSLVASATLLGWLVYRFPSVLPWSVFLPLIVLGGLFLATRYFVVVDIAVMTSMLYAGYLTAWWDPQFWGNVVIAATVAVLMGWLVSSRARLGVSGTFGETMLVDLRDRLRAHGELPELPEPWHAEVALQPAYGDSFSGDFVVATKSADGRVLEIALVDVSGKGLHAGTRSLLLSGALGGLLGAMPADRFLPAANSYLLRQDWNEGFATAIHLALHLESGAFSVGSAGHPPAVQFSAGSGLWELLDHGNGPILGVLAGADFPRTQGQLNPGDAMLLYTDGVIEARSRDLSVGIDRMLGAAERLVSQGFAGGATRICAGALGGDTDDRAVIMVWRR